MLHRYSVSGEMGIRQSQRRGTLRARRKRGGIPCGSRPESALRGVETMADGLHGRPAPVRPRADLGVQITVPSVAEIFLSPSLHKQKQTMANNGEEKRIRCPICGKPFSPRQSDALPFCSGRCRNIDLYRWLKEDYALPLPPRLDDEEDAPREEAHPGRED